MHHDILTYTAIYANPLEHTIYIYGTPPPGTYHFGVVINTIGLHVYTGLDWYRGGEVPDKPHLCPHTLFVLTVL